jgi:hypothetical protein
MNRPLALALAALLSVEWAVPLSEAALTADVTTLVQVTSSPGGPQAFQEAGGEVVIEAEHFDEKIARSSHDWLLQTATVGFVAEGYLQVLPNSGTTINTGYVTTSPELAYRVLFATPGTYFLWVRGQADSTSDDSLHAGLDGTGPASADRIGDFPASWTWWQDTMDGAPATLVIPSAGLHTVHLWMRQDGLKVDRFLLRLASTVPSGPGPAESARVAIPTDTTAPLITAVTSSNVGATTATITWTTDEPATSQVEYGLTTDYGQTSPLDASLVTSHNVLLTGLAPETMYHFRALSADAANNSASSGDGTFTTLLVTDSAFQESGGQVVIEAEHFDAKTPRSGKDWVFFTSKTGFSGDGYLRANPNTGTLINSGYVTTSPELAYNVDFTTTGLYYVWVRGSANSSSDDSVHAGLDATATSSSDRMNGWTSSWSWRRTTLDGVVATVNILTAGRHTIHLWMREDGLRVDKLLLRTNSSSTAPSGQGPAESPRSGGPPPS